MATLMDISSSLRADSVNTKLVNEVARLFAPSSFTLADIRLPFLMNQLATLVV